MLAFTNSTTPSTIIITTTTRTSTPTTRSTLPKLMMLLLGIFLLTTQHVAEAAPQQGLNFFNELTQLLNANANAATNFLTAESNNNLPSELSISNNGNQLPPSPPTATATTTNQLGNFLPVNSLIAAAALPETPAPVQFVRTAMNSGLRR